MVRTLLLLALIAAPLAFGEARRRAPATAEDTAKVEEGIAAIRRLTLHFDNAASGSRRARIFRGGALVAATGYLTGVYIAQNKLLSGDKEVIALGVVGTTGVIFTVGGLLTAIVPTAPERGPAWFRSIPARNLREIEEKIDRGEAELRRFADRERFSRRVIGGGFLAVGVADLIWFLGTGPDEELNFLPYLAGLYGGVGILLLTLKTPAETEYETYLEEKRERKGLTGPRGPTVDWGITPMEGGMKVGLRLRF